MTITEQKIYEALPTTTARAAWLLAQLDRGRVAVDLDLQASELGLCWRVSVAGVMLPLACQGPRSRVVGEARAWLQDRTVRALA
ncbi:MAG: hypothetical protein WC881_12275 [Elusimicrobiota bacterium]|jgi:hypothetical protein